MSADVPARATFCVLGAGKAGTTWLFEVLAAHPHVTVARAKETMFFDENFHRGLAWYHSLFPDSTGQPVGEVSNSYFAAPAVPERMAAYNPGMRLVALLRDPIDRALSNYLFFVRNGQVSGSFEAALAERPDILDHGFYGQHLARYLDHFPSSAVHLAAYDDLAVVPDVVASGVLAHIGASQTDLPDVVRERVLPASSPRSRAVAAVVKRCAVMARHLGAPGLVTRIKRGPLPGMLYRPLTAKPEIAAETAARLHDLYAADVELLTGLTGRDWGQLWWPQRATPPSGVVNGDLPRPRASVFPQQGGLVSSRGE